MPSKLPPEELRRLNSMCYFIEEIKKAGIKPKTILDIGSYNSAHLAELCDVFDVPRNKGYAFEAHEGMHKHCLNRGINLIKGAISNYDGTTIFNAIDLTQPVHHGCSSIYHMGKKYNKIKDRPYNTVNLPVHRIDTLMENGTIPNDSAVVKIDVEGKSFEVLEGFGKYLKNVKILHVETEIIDLYGGQKIRSDIEKFMRWQGFRVVHSLYVPEFQDDLIFLNNKI